MNDKNTNTCSMEVVALYDLAIKNRACGRGKKNAERVFRPPVLKRELTDENLSNGAFVGRKSTTRADKWDDWWCVEKMRRPLERQLRRRHRRGHPRLRDRLTCRGREASPVSYYRGVVRGRDFALPFPNKRQYRSRARSGHRPIINARKSRPDSSTSRRTSV